MRILSTDRPFDAVVFDFDNTLFDYEATEREALRCTLCELDIPYDEDSHPLFKRINRSLWEQTERDGSFAKRDLRTQRFSRYLSSLGIEDTGELAARASEAYIRHSERGVLIDGVYDTLVELKERGYVIGVASAGLSCPRDAKLRSSLIAPLVDFAMYREDFDNLMVKPHPDFFDRVAKKLEGIPRARILYVGDTYHSDVLAPSECGFSSLWFNFFGLAEENDRPKRCYGTIYSFRELISVIDKERKMKVDKEYEYLYSIPGSESFVDAKTVGGGWSADLKFRVVDKDGNKYLLRVSDISLKAKKEAEFNVLKSLEGLGISYSQPLMFGELTEYGKVYMLLTWMDGENVEIMMPKLTREEQYACGVKAGQILRKMHTLSSDGSIEAWRNKNLKKLNERLELYKQCDGYVIEHLDEMVAFINENLDLMENRPMTFLHGDYQGRNIVVDENCNVCAIDFERTAYGDPYEEFNRMMTYTRRWSVDFCRGQVDGYFEGEKIPDDFWRIVAFHCALNLITTIVFGVHTGQKHIYEENEIAKQVIYDDFKGYTSFPPEWFVNRD